MAVKNVTAFRNRVKVHLPFQAVVLFQHCAASAVPVSVVRRLPAYAQSEIVKKQIFIFETKGLIANDDL
jgi:hypothetical protein